MATVATAPTPANPISHAPAPASTAASPKKTTASKPPAPTAAPASTSTSTAPPAKPDDAARSEKGDKDTKASTNGPLAPPPKPGAAGADYFAPNHSAHFSLEPNPFEQSFGQPAETPSRFSGLPSVQSLTSPAPINGPGATPDWHNSLRHGPLSPAMLTGPTPNGGDYFDSAFRQSFPTPNESSLRSTGLTPGGPSMFPAPSPNSQAIFNSMNSGTATPGTLDFQRTAAQAARKAEQPQQPSQPQNGAAGKQEYQPASTFNNNSESDAVNSLLMFANNGQRNSGYMPPASNTRAAGSKDTSPTANRGRASMGSTASNGEYLSDVSVEPKGKKGSSKKSKAASAGIRRKAEEPPGNKSSKKQKLESLPPPDEDDDEDDDMGDSDDDMQRAPGGKKLTDEEKRKNFLERNRVAALKCRQRKKQWLNNLQAKVEIFTTENDALTNQLSQLREENQNLKALLLQHKDCPVSHSQGLGGARMAQVLGADFADGPGGPGGPPYAQHGQHGMPAGMMMGQAHQR